MAIFRAPSSCSLKAGAFLTAAVAFGMMRLAGERRPIKSAETDCRSDQGTKAARAP